MAIIETIFTNILPSIIYDTLHYLFFPGEKENNKTSEEKKLIEDFIRTKNFSEFSELLESGIFQEYIESPQVHDMILDYFTYTINSKNSRNIKETEICSCLANNLLKRYDLEITKPKKVMAESFFAFIFKCIDEYFKQLLNTKEKFALSSIHRTMEIRAFETHKKIDMLTSLIKKSMNLEVKEKRDECDKIKIAYMSTLQDKNRKAHIYLLDYFDLNKFYVPPVLGFGSHENLSFGLNSSGIIMPRYKFDDSVFEIWKNIFYNNNMVYIIGGAGYGKSLFMRNIIINYDTLNLFDVQDHIVIYGELKKFIQSNAHRQKSVLDFLQDCMIASTGIDKTSISKEFIQYYLDLGRCIILLDALDEVDKSKRRDLHETVIAFFSNNNPHNKICITSRARGFIPIDDSISCFRIFPLERKQIEKYVENIIELGKFARADKESFMKQAEKLIEKGFLNSFLVLSLLINIYKAERELPENKLELYQKCFEYIATRREKDKIDKQFQGGPFDWEKIGLLMKDNTFIELSNLTFPNNMDVSKKKIKDHLTEIYKNKYGNEVSADNAIDEFLNFCSERTELFVPTLEEKFRFFHRTFFEYFYSLYIFTRCEKISDVYDKMEQFDIDSEVFELTIAIFKKSSEEKYQKILEYIFDKINIQINQNKNRFDALNKLILMMQVIDDVFYRDEFIKLLINYKTEVSKYSDQLSNKDIVIRLIMSNDNYKASINEAYYFISINEILLLNLTMDTKLLDEDEITEDLRRSIILNHMRILSTLNFYTVIFLRTKDLYDELNNFKLDNITNQKEYKKFMKAYNKYMNYDEKKKRAFCKLFYDAISTD
jgi:hypothetical protein